MTSALATLLACAGQTVLYAQEPIIQTKYTADPAPMVYNDTVFLYTSHDEDDAQGYGFKMLDWQLYTSTDMVNWTDHGEIFHVNDIRPKDAPASDKWAVWAPDFIYKDGKYYLIMSGCTGWAPNQGKCAVADSMEGDWGMLKKIGDETTYQSQAAFLLNLNGQLLYIGDRWNAENYFESGYVAYPLKVENGELVMEYCEETDLGKYL